MLSAAVWIYASFTSPMEIGTTAWELLWLLPLVGGIAVVYKAVKEPKSTAFHFIKESVLLFCSIAVFMVLAGAALYVIVEIITQ